MPRANPRVLAVVVVAVAILGGIALFRARGEPAAPPAAPAGTPSLPRPPAEPVAFAIMPGVEDRWSKEPCNLVFGAGLWSFPAFRDGTAAVNKYTIAISLGDLSTVPGELGRLLSMFAVDEVLVPGGTQAISAGVEELKFGVEFARQALSAPARNILCANAADPQGQPVLKGYVLADAGGRTVMIAAVAADSLQAPLAERGSDIRLLPAAESLRATVARAEAQAKDTGRTLPVRVLLVQGTKAEAAALVKEVPGFTFAVAARGGPLPDQEALDAGGVSVLYPGRAFRFGLRVRVDGEGATTWTNSRIGIQMERTGSPIAQTFRDHDDIMRRMWIPGQILPEDRRPADPRGTYVGSERCGVCHTEIVAQHRDSSHSRLSKGIAGTDDIGRPSCLGCHVTAPFVNSGWRGPSDTSDLASVSCEACHGPGSEHAEKPAAGWGKVGFDACLRCHTPERSPDFDPAAKWKAQGHALKR